MTDIIKKYKKTSIQVKASIWFIVSSFLQKGISFFIMPIYTRLMSTQQYGIYSVTISWFDIMLVFTALNLFSNTYNVGLTKYSNKRNELTTSLISLCSLITIVAFGSLFFFRNYWIRILGISLPLTVCIFVYLFFEPVNNFWLALKRYQYEYKNVIVFTFIVSVFTPIISIVLIINTEYKAEAAVLSKVLLSTLMGSILLYQFFRKSKTVYSKEYWSFALKMNVPLIPYYLSIRILSQFDRLMINNICGPDKAGIYSLAYAVSNALLILNSSLNAAFIPWLYQKLKVGDILEVRKIYRLLLALICIVNLLFMFFAPELINIFATSNYREAVFIIPPLVMCVVLNFVYQHYINIEFYFEKSRITMFASIGVAIINIILNLIFIPRFGYLVAAYTTVFSYLFFCLTHYFCFHFICCKEKIDLRIIDNRFNLILVVITGICTVCVNVVYDLSVLRYMMVGLVILVFICNKKYIRKELMKLKNKE